MEKLGYAGDDLDRRLAIFETAVRYQMFHAIALVFIGLALQHRDSPWWRFAAWAFLVGIVLFCGLLKVLTFADPKWNWLGAIVPIGGVSMIARLARPRNRRLEKVGLSLIRVLHS